jgi:hypothetical protein
MSSNDSSKVVMQGLKDFQRRTVDHVFARMFDPHAPARRFLVADEVGLGKTLVAKGLIARTIAHLQSTGSKRVDVIYVCSNADIALQNVDRLMQPDQPAFCGATRLTLLPLMTGSLNEHPVNFISFTPGTTFQTNRTGRKEERQLIYQMLRYVHRIDRRGLRNAMKGAAGDGWDQFAERPLEFDADIAASYCARVAEDEALMVDIGAVMSVYRDRRHHPTAADEERCVAMTGRLRRLLAKTCLSALEPDLVILDEFQRFGELFDDPETNPAAELAHELFNYSDDLRVLLLSATPYKMYATDDDGEDHYADFIRTLRFLAPSQQDGVAQLEQDIGEFRTALLDMDGASASDLAFLSQIKQRIEEFLKTVMCRTERVGTTVRADAMVSECILVPQLTARDLVDFRTLDTIAQRLGEPDTVEYWKSSPYLLNFMREYTFKMAVRGDQKNRTSLIGDLIAPQRGNALSPGEIEQFQLLDPGNARLRTLLTDIDRQGVHRLLWMPPSMPYWIPAGVYQDVGQVSKQLIFSAWNVVPDALAALVSYEIERKIVEEANSPDFGYAEMSNRFKARLRLARQSDGRLTGMWNLMLMYPSNALATLIDPLRWVGVDGQLLALGETRRRAAACLAIHIEKCVDRSVEHGNEDRRWYWVVLARLEASLAPGSDNWCDNHWRYAGHRIEADDHELDHTSIFTAHVDQLLEAWRDGITGLGRVPADLTDILVALALGGPATCALRALSRQAIFSESSTEVRLNAAARIAEGLRSQFNSPRAIALLKGSEDDGSYWEKVLHYCADGNLQAVLDEQVHLLTESVGKAKKERAAVDRVADAMFEAMTVRTVTLRPDEVSVEDGRLRVEKFATGIRSHFAVRFGGKEDDEGGVSRKKMVQAAFNSPFWPFVMVSTSVGQEGLDFHPWCHAVVHWNLPSNPVDMEQREGRVHRYKGYAVRKNVAASYGGVVRGASAAGLDPWDDLFARATAGRAASCNDLIPYWIYELEGGACIERRVMVMPMSREAARYKRLKRSLALYRMVFAQPRQEDLLACLEQSIGEERAAVVAAQYRINLAPSGDGN